MASLVGGPSSSAGVEDGCDGGTDGASGAAAAGGLRSPAGVEGGRDGGSDGASAAAAAVDFTGVWREASLHNLDAFLKGMGVGWIKRKAAAQLIKLKTQRQTVLYDPSKQTIIIRVEGKPSGDEEHTLNIGSPTEVPGKLSDGKETTLTLNLAWSDDRTVLVNDFVNDEGGRLIVRRSMVGDQMKVECRHMGSGAAMWRMFDRVEQNKTVGIGEDGKLVLSA